MKREKSNYMILSVSHALDVLEELTKSGGEIGVTELSKRLQLHKNNVFRLLATLELRGYVEQNRDSENYRIGVKALQLGQAYLAQSTLVARATPILKALGETLGETVSLAVLHNGYVQFPISIEGRRPVKVSPRVAVSLPAKMSAPGRLLTAHLSDQVLAELLATNTPQDAAIKAQLAELRASGAIIDRGAIESDVVAVCRVVKNSQGDVLGAIEVLVPQYRAKIEQLGPTVEEAATTLSTALGSIQKRTLSHLVEQNIERAVVAPAKPLV